MFSKGWITGHGKCSEQSFHSYFVERVKRGRHFVKGSWDTKHRRSSMFYYKHTSTNLCFDPSKFFFFLNVFCQIIVSLSPQSEWTYVKTDVGLIFILNECVLHNFSVEWTVGNIQPSQGSSDLYSHIFYYSFKALWWICMSSDYKNYVWIRNS